MKNTKKETKIYIPGSTGITKDYINQERTSIDSATDMTLTMNIQALVFSDKHTVSFPISTSPLNKEVRHSYRMNYSKHYKNQPESFSPYPKPPFNELPINKPPKAPLKPQIFSFMKKFNPEGRESVSKLPAFNSSRMTNPAYKAAHFNILKKKNHTRRKTERDRSLDIGMIHSKEFKFDTPHEPKPFKLVHVPISTSAAHRSDLSRINSLEFFINTSRIRRRENVGL